MELNFYTISGFADALALRIPPFEIASFVVKHGDAQTIVSSLDIGIENIKNQIREVNPHSPLLEKNGSEYLIAILANIRKLINN